MSMIFTGNGQHTYLPKQRTILDTNLIPTRLFLKFYATNIIFPYILMRWPFAIKLVVTMQYFPNELILLGVAI